MHYSNYITSLSSPESSVYINSKAGDFVADSFRFNRESLISRARELIGVKLAICLAQKYVETEARFTNNVIRSVEFPSCFISYASKDDAFAQQLYFDLRAVGVQCWFAPEDMKIGDEFRSHIDESIHIHDKLLLILSKDSLASRWVQKEVETAFEKEAKQHCLVLFPIKIDDTIMQSTAGWAADIRRMRHIGDFCQWRNHEAYQQSLNRLLRDLKVVRSATRGRGPLPGEPV